MSHITTGLKVEILTRKPMIDKFLILEQQAIISVIYFTVITIIKFDNNKRFCMNNWERDISRHLLMVIMWISCFVFTEAVHRHGQTSCN